MDVGNRTGISVTADDVAALAGVSRWTVNRAFKKNASISESSRLKVLEAADHLGYAPDLLAASLATDKSNYVALLIDEFSNPYKLVMLERLTRLLRANGWDTMLVNTLDTNDASAALLHVSQRRVDAAVLIGSNFDDQDLEAAQGGRRIRQLITFARTSKTQGTVSICCEDRLAMMEITDHVISRGYKKPVFLAGPQRPSAHLLRKDTFRSRWLEKVGTEPIITSVDVYDPQLAYRHMNRFFADFAPEDRPDVIVCENDALAIGTIDALKHTFGMEIPRDIAVTGFDDAPQAANPNYLLTTYRQPISEMAQGLVDVLKGTAHVPDLTKFEGQLIIRDSA